MYLSEGAAEIILWVLFVLILVMISGGTLVMLLWAYKKELKKGIDWLLKE